MDMTPTPTMAVLYWTLDALSLCFGNTIFCLVDAARCGCEPLCTGLQQPDLHSQRKAVTAGHLGTAVLPLQSQITNLLLEEDLMEVGRPDSLNLGLTKSN